MRGFRYLNTVAAFLGAAAAGPVAYAYYVSATGSDSNPGTQSQPWQTLAKVAAQSFLPNTTVYLHGGDSFAGTLTLPASSGTVGKPIKYTSYGTGKATIAPAASTNGIYGTDLSNIIIDNLKVTGNAGTDGIGIRLDSASTACVNWTVTNCDVSNMASIGIWLMPGAGGSITGNVVNNNTVNNCTTGFNGATSGIRITGSVGTQFSKAYNCVNITMVGNSVTNCPGIAGTPSWCGSGAFIQRAKGTINVTDNIFYNNGTNCNNPAGPSALLFGFTTGAYVTRNVFAATKTASSDGGGLDFDGGCDNCLAERNVSIGNAGFGYMSYEYDDANFSANSGILFRYNISLNDVAGALRLVSGGTHDSSGQAYGNTFVSSQATQLVRLEKQGGALNWTIANNIIMSTKAGTSHMITTLNNPSGCLFYGNNYYTPNTYDIVWNGTTYTSVAAWRAAVTSQETLAGSDTSKLVAPVFISPSPNLPFRLFSGETMRPDESSPVLNAGVDLFTNFGINPGTTDFYGSMVSPAGPWSIGHAAIWSALKSTVLSTTGDGLWTVPPTFAQLHAVDCLGAGGSNNAFGAGAGGAAFARSYMQTAAASWVAGTTTVPYHVAAAVSGSNGENTSFGSTTLAGAIALGKGSACGAEGGKTNSGTTGGLGGLGVNSLGDIVYDGGSAGNGTANGTSGGGGAASLFGPGQRGGDGPAASGRGVGGGGGAGGGLPGNTATSAVGGTGGAGPFNSAGGAGGNLAAGTAGVNGSGGGGAGTSGGAGGNGGNGVDWSTNGSGGASGGGLGTVTAAIAGLFGAGAGGRNNGLGAQGGIRALWKTSASVRTYADGYGGAPAATVQHPTLLAGFGFRPPWKVAGVDYAVGYPDATVLKDWRTIDQGSGAVTLSASRVRIDGNNVTLDGYDFTLGGGADITIYGANTVISNSKLTWTSAVQASGSISEIGIQSSASNTTISNCVIDGNANVLGAAAANQTSLITANGTGSLTLRYNWFKNFNQHVVELGSAAAATLDMQFNLIENGGCGATGQHMNFSQFSSAGNYTSALIRFNTTWEPTTNASGGEGFQMYNNSTGNVTGEMAWNTMLASPDGSGMPHISDVPSGGGGLSHVAVHENYLYKNGSTYYFYNDTTGRNAYANNIDMVTGATVS